MSTLGERLINIPDAFSWLDLTNLVYFGIFLSALFMSRLFFVIPFVVYSRRQRARVAASRRADPRNSSNTADEDGNDEGADTEAVGGELPPLRETAGTLSHPPRLVREDVGLEYVTLANFTDHLVRRDNKSLAIAYAGYLVAVARILAASMFADFIDPVTALLQALVWTFVGISCLVIAHYVNDYGLLPRMFSSAEIVRRENVAVGLVEAGMSVATGQVIAAALQGDAGNYVDGFASVFAWFLIGQAMLVLTVWIYQLATRYNDQTELAKGNAAAGLSMALNVVAMGKLVAVPIAKSDELLHFFLVWSIGLLIYLFVRIFTDKALVPGRSIDDEILQDQNWGSAFIDGVVLLSFVFVLEAILPSNKVVLRSCYSPLF